MYKEHRGTCNKKYKELKIEGKDPIHYKPSSVKSQDDPPPPPSSVGATVL